MSIYRDLSYLEHIKESIEKIQAYTSNLTEETFQESSLIQDAVVRQFEIIGEASKKLSDDIKPKKFIRTFCPEGRRLKMRTLSVFC